MKAIEILLEAKKVNEAPANIVGQGLKRLGAGVLGAMGAKGMAGNLQGSAESGAKANELHANFQKYLGQIGKTTKTAEYADLQAFLKANKMNPSAAKGNGPLNQKAVDQIFTSIAQNSFKAPAVGGKKSSAQPADTGAQQSAEPAQTTKAAPATGTQGASQNQVGKMTLTQIKQAVSGLRTRDKESLMAFLQQGTKQSAKPTATKPAGTTAPAQTAEPATTSPATDKAAAVKKVATTAKAAGVDPAKAVKATQQPAKSNTPPDPGAPEEEKPSPDATREYNPRAGTWGWRSGTGWVGDEQDIQPEPAQAAPDEQGRIEPTMEPASRVKADQGGKQLGTKQSDAGANFDTQTGKVLPGRAINAVRRKSEVGAGVLGKTRAKINKKTSGVAV